MDLFARRAFERLDVEADGAGCNPRQHSLLGTWGKVVADAIASSSGGSVTELSVTGGYRGGR